ncbi:MAG TPA: type II toxin-antitoxin system PrlF family antitoxin [Caulobacteraceae bacterium]|jgi:AbrB family looped-hinge helix DNA binding protein
MKMTQSTVTAKGQTTIPKEIRDRLGLKPRSKIRYLVTHDGTVMLAPVLPVSALRGILKYDGPPVSLEEMDDAIKAGAVERFERSNEP